MSGASADTGDLEDATVLTDRQVENFNTNGFLNIGQVLDNKGCERFRSEMLRVAAGIYDRAPIQLRNVNQDENAPVLQISNIWHSSSIFFDHMSLPAITDAVAELTGSAVLRVWHDQVQSKPAKIGGSTAWHQDAPAWPILEPPDLITAWVPFQDTTIENGCMWMVPGSHLWGDQEAYLDTGEHFRPRHKDLSRLPAGTCLQAVPVEVSKGECHLHHCLTWHGSDANRTGTIRAAIAVHYMPGHIRYIKRGTHDMEKYVEVEEGAILRGDAFPVVRGSSATT